MRAAIVGVSLFLFGPTNGTSPQTTAAPKAPTRLELAFIDGKTTSSYTLTTPDKNFPSRLKIEGPEQSLSVEFVWLKDGSALQYDIKRTTFNKPNSNTLDLVGTITLPSSGRASLTNTPGLSLELGFAQ